MTESVCLVWFEPVGCDPLKCIPNATPVFLKLIISLQFVKQQSDREIVTKIKTLQNTELSRLSWSSLLFNILWRAPLFFVQLILKEFSQEQNI